MLLGKPQLLKSQSHSPVHISIVHGLSNKGQNSKDHSFNGSFNLFTGATGSVSGFQLGSFYNDNRGAFRGFQLSGLVNRTRNNFSGLQLAGLSNISGHLHGLQIAGLNNHAGHTSGAQIAGLVNTAKNIKGIQTSGLVNYADTLQGVQISGLFNKVHTLHGFQIGLINIADTVSRGVPFGLISIIRKGGFWSLEAGYADYQQASLQYRVGLNALYTIIGGGYSDGPDKLLSTTFGIGQRYLNKKWGHLRNELLFLSYHETNLEKGSGPYAIHFQTGISIHLGPHFYLALQPSLSLTTWQQEDLDQNWKTTRIQPIKTWEDTHRRRNLGAGFRIGLGYRNQ